jgi:predicted RNA-binding Zn-ribbon protein involved in translation (DUF1610 family)
MICSECKTKCKVIAYHIYKCPKCGKEIYDYGAVNK